MVLLAHQGGCYQGVEERAEYPKSEIPCLGAPNLRSYLFHDRMRCVVQKKMERVERFPADRRGGVKESSRYHLTWTIKTFERLTLRPGPSSPLYTLGIAVSGLILPSPSSKACLGYLLEQRSQQDGDTTC